MNTEEKQIARQKHPDRLTIERAALDRLDVWIKDLTDKVPGIHLTKNALLNWLILSQAAELSPAQVADLTTQFYDEERFLKYACREIKRAKQSGSKLTLTEIINRQSKSVVTKVPRKTRAKRNKDEVNELPFGEPYTELANVD